MARTPLEQDVPCAECGYNLRGLTTADRCPECGTPVIDTTEAGAEPQESEHVAAARRAQATAAAEASGYRLSAVLFVSAVLNYTLRHLRSEAQEHVTAQDVCAGFAEYALYFNDSAERWTSCPSGACAA